MVATQNSILTTTKTLANASNQNNVDTTKTITHLSLCSGYDGIGLGLRRIWPNVREVAHVEIEAFAAANLVAKMERGKLDSAPVWTDLKTFPAWSFQGKVDILSGGFPCQPFSSAGKRSADNDPRHLWPWIRQAIGLVRPRMVVLENVQGIISAKLKGGDWNDPEGTSVLLHVLRELERTGYQCAWGVFSAAEVGAPHQRKRVFILAYRNCEGLQGMLQNFGSQGRETEGRSTARCGEHCEAELAHCDNQRCDKEQISVQPGRSQQEGDEIMRSSRATRWPARLGEPQHEWEEPRVTETQSELGRATNGASSRVDRLRLLGNGVVPQTAEQAVRVLMQHFM